MNVTLWRIRPTTVTMETQQYIPFVLIHVDAVANNTKVFIVDMGMQQWTPWHCYPARQRSVLLSALSIEFYEFMFYFLSLFACKSHLSGCTVLLCHLRSVWLYHIFPRYLKKGRIFGNKLLNERCVF
jgi:hypothetical protein